MTEKRYFVSGYSVWDSYNNNRRIDTQSKPICDLLNQLNEENEQLKHFIQELTTNGTGKIHLANGNIYEVNAILTDIKM